MKSSFIFKYTSVRIIPILLLAGLLFSCKANDKNSKKEKTAAAAIILLSQTSSCSGTSITRNWGTFTDCNNGTIKFAGVAGTFGGNSYPAQTLYFTKCAYGQTYNSATNDCNGTAKEVQFCKTDDNSCDNTITVTSGPLFNACNGLSVGGTLWRVPTKNELKLLISCTNTNKMPDYDNQFCPEANSQNIINLFPIPNTDRDSYWSSNVCTDSRIVDCSLSWADLVDFHSGWAPTTGKNNSNGMHVLCVSNATYSIGGTITGLTADGLVLQNNSADDLTVASSATTFTFATRVSSAYSVTVKTQPTGLTCTVSNGSGTATADVTNVTVACTSGSSASSCAGTSVTRNWGTFTDMCNGTVKLVVNAGTFGGNTYTSKTMYFAKCGHGQTYDSSGNTCTGTVTAVQFCNANNTTCNGGTNAGTLNGSGTSGAYSACNGLSLAGKSWRVPTRAELKLLINCTTATEMPNDATACSSYSAPTVNSLFPNTSSSNYWSSSGYPGNSTDALAVDFNSGYSGNGSKTTTLYVRCASDSP